MRGPRSPGTSCQRYTPELRNTWIMNRMAIGGCSSTCCGGRTFPMGYRRFKCRKKVLRPEDSSSPTYVQNRCRCEPDPVRPECTLSLSKGKSKGERRYMHKFQT